jgi:hypothetical protein
MTGIVAALACWQPCFSFGLGKLTIGATTGQNDFQYLRREAHMPKVRVAGFSVSLAASVADFLERIVLYV